jgi:hypothetical protein
VVVAVLDWGLCESPSKGRAPGFRRYEETCENGDFAFGGIALVEPERDGVLTVRTAQRDMANHAPVEIRDPHLYHL